MHFFRLGTVLALVWLFASSAGLRAATLSGEIVDAQTGKAMPGRLYIHAEKGGWFFAESVAPEGSALRYQKQNGANKNAIEHHTTLSAHPFTVELPPGLYTISAERGKEYRALERRLEIKAEPVTLKLPLRRWVNMADRGWFSGDTHLHRDPVELPNVMLAEDVNVALPMVYWTQTDSISPKLSDKNFKGEYPAKPVYVDGTHAYYPRNTEYEIFNTGGKRHTLGALVAVNHKTILDLPALPISKVAARARAEGALLDLEKHNWDWTAAIVPLVKPDLFELANNHLWRTEYGATNWAVPAPAWMQIGTGGTSEREWALYGLQTYYALLDCGFRPMPTAGTAHGVHPVPLGYGRVYVNTGKKFDYAAWMKGLREGRSFVTTGPMLLAEVNGEQPGYKGRSRNLTRKAEIKGKVVSEVTVNRIEVILNGRVTHVLQPRSRVNGDSAWEADFEASIELKGTSWVAIRCWEDRPDGKARFAHTAPWFFDVRGMPNRPRKEEVGWLIQRVQAELKRSEPVLPPEAIAEYRKALAAYEEIARYAE